MSRTWWRTSTRSSSSDPPNPGEAAATSAGPGSVRARGFAGSFGGLVAAGHPFPSILNALASGTIAVVAGGSGGVAIRLGVAMLLIQLSIGAANDLADAGRDAVAQPAKPIPAGRVGRPWVVGLAVVGGVAGLGLAATFGPTVLAVAAAGAGLGYLYDLRARGTTWAWLPLAVALPLVPIFGWLGATGGIPPALAVLVPAGGLAGTALAVANAAADLERDAAAGLPSVATRLGLDRVWRVGLVAWLAAVGLVVVSLATAERAVPAQFLVGSGLGSLAIAGGLGLGRSSAADRRRLGWEVQAIGAAVLGASWLAAVAVPG